MQVMADKYFYLLQKISNMHSTNYTIGSAQDNIANINQTALVKKELFVRVKS